MIEALLLGDWHASATWLISLSCIGLILIRPKGLREAWWAVFGACLLVLCRLISPGAAISAVEKGIDVYLFLIGMMMMSELARREGVFNWMAGHAVRASKGSRGRLFVLIYCIGILVTIFLSNDATAVVLTPAVLAAVRAADTEPLPYLFACAFIANAASFVLPISNPANLVVYSRALPPLGHWMTIFALPSLAAILVTFAILRCLAAKSLEGTVRIDVDDDPLSGTGKMTLYGIGFLSVILMIASAFRFDLGAPACVAVVIPNMKKAVFVFSGEYGKGFATCRNPEGTGWTAPAAMRIEGGGFGLQAGGESADIVMLMMSDKGMQGILASKFTLGGEASVAAGPVGRDATAQTDATMHADLLSWSRSRGVFGGMSLQGGRSEPMTTRTRRFMAKGE